MATFSTEVIRLAQESEEKYGVPASVTLAQYALESGYGKSTLAKTKNNYFGMRNGSKGWQEFGCMAESFDAHGKLLASERYSSKTANASNVTEYVNAIAETYAPSSDGNNNYSGKILSIIEQNNLTQYDGGSYGGTVTTTTTTTGSGGLGSSILSAVVQALAVLLLCVLFVMFFMTAFDMKVPSKTDFMKKAVGVND